VTDSEHEHHFRAMNTEVRLIVIAEDRDGWVLLECAAQEFSAHERTLSRFDPASELSALNRLGSRWTPVSPLLFRALTVADELRRQTGGLYNPAILPALEAAGYDRSFEELAQTGSGRSQTKPGSAWQPGHPIPVTHEQPYELRPRRRTVRLVPGARLDLGGIGKGLAVDAAAAALRSAHGFLVDAGGDIRIGGVSPDGGLWGIAVQDPTNLDRDLAVLALTDGAVATCSVGRRRWVHDGSVQHHLIDPRTGKSAVSDVLAATVIASSCATAEVFAKAAVIAGAAAGFTLLARFELAGLVVDAERHLRANAALEPFLVATNS
jgi:thiamine biosynthesis lipoprotein